MSKIKVIANIIKEYMKLDEEHIYIYNNKWIIPEDKGLCVVLSIENNKIIATNKYYEKNNNIYTEIAEIINQEQININIFSYDKEAIERKEEIIMALNSDYSVNKQNQLSFHIAEMPTSFNSINELDGTKILNRFNILVNVIEKSRKETETKYFDNFGYILRRNKVNN